MGRRREGHARLRPCIGKALPVWARCCINRDDLRLREQVNSTAQLRPLKFRVASGASPLVGPEAARDV
jgi:hypothetical protein